MVKLTQRTKAFSKVERYKFNKEIIAFICKNNHLENIMKEKILLFTVTKKILQNKFSKKCEENPKKLLKHINRELKKILSVTGKDN